MQNSFAIPGFIFLLLFANILNSTTTILKHDIILWIIFENQNYFAVNKSTKQCLHPPNYCNCLVGPKMATMRTIEQKTMFGDRIKIMWEEQLVDYISSVNVP